MCRCGHRSSPPRALANENPGVGGVEMLWRIFIALTVIFYSSQGLRAEDSKPPLQIGAILPFTGFANVWADQARRGIDLAVDEINADGGLEGRKVEVLYEDSSSNPTAAVNAFNKLVQTGRVKAVVGDIISFLTLPLVPLAEQQHILLVTPSVFDTTMPAGTRYFYSTCPRKESIRPPVRTFFRYNKAIQSVVIICANNTWGLTYLDIWKEEAAAHGVKVLDTNCIDDPTSDMRAEILRAKSRKPDGIIVAMGIDRALRRMREAGMRAVVLTTSDLMEAVEMRGLPLSEAEGVYFNDWKPSREFQDAFADKYHHSAIMEPQNSYEALRSVFKAYALDSGNLAAGIRKVKYDGVMGPIDFTESTAGNQAEGELLQVKQGNLEAVQPR